MRRRDPDDQAALLLALGWLLTCLGFLALGILMRCSGGGL